MKDYFAEQGNYEIRGAKDAVRCAFKNELIIDGDGWMKMIGSRNLGSHTYDNEIADKILNSVISSYYNLFQEFQLKMQSLVVQDLN